MNRNLRLFLINVGIFILVIIVTVFLLSAYLKWYTHHNESLTVPDIKGQHIEKAKEILSDKDLRFEITDSVFAPDKPKLSVVEQNPKSGSKVKRGRRIYLIINVDKPPLVIVPNLDQVPLRQAKSILESYGFKVGELIYVPDIALNAVQGMKFKGREIQPGIKIEKGSSIDLMLGDGGKTQKKSVPDLTGMSLDAGKLVLLGNNLNIGAIFYDNDVTDQGTAIIYKQNPLPGSGNVPQGEAIDVYLMDAEKYDKLYGDKDL